MNVLIAAFTTERYMPYWEKYRMALEKNNCTYDIILMDRDSDKGIRKVKNVYYYSYKMPIEKKIWSKFLPYLGYKKFAEKVLNQNSYDSIIFLTTAPAVLLFSSYIKKYRKKYVLDYRDYTFEGIRPYQSLVKKIVSYSFATFISSAGFKRYVGDGDNVFLTHNISNYIGDDAPVSFYNKEGKIRIGFIGCIRYFDINSKLIDIFANSDRHEMIYIGTSYSDCDLKKYCEENKISNVYFQGMFDNCKKKEFYEDITFINAVYSLHSPEVRYAVPNRLYDAAIYKKPIIVSKGTYLEEIVKKYLIGISIDIYKDDVVEIMDEYIRHFNASLFLDGCNSFLKDVWEDEKRWHLIMDSFLTI